MRDVLARALARDGERGVRAGAQQRREQVARADVRVAAGAIGGESARARGALAREHARA